ncbi:hypothetical protein [Methylibium sp.]|uniref:hypothetical protein n=1 Tax=Methylibium sp. TaxID=2067992 RepID=UPI0017D9E25A|nr:hypothetical protein [Methylibium sp.]MBA3588517.1 hypothetical protein [Methylibium sp.]
MMRTIASTTAGPIRTVIQAKTMSLLSFLPAERNLILRTVMQAAGDFWIRTFLPKRFTPYARRLGYSVGRKWQTSKERQTAGPVLPFVGLTPAGGGPPAPGWSQRNGEKMIVAAMRGATAKGMSKGLNKQSVIIRIPFGHAVRAETSATFRFIPSWEMARLAEIISKTLADIIGSARLRPSARPGRVAAQFSRTIIGASSRNIGAPSQRKVA